MRLLFAYDERPNFPPRYNIAPTQPIPIVHQVRGSGAGRRRFGLARWGFLPGFVKDPKDFPLIFNGRAEGLGQKACFRNALRRRRCLVPVDAFYEWQRTGSAKTSRAQPYLCRRSDGQTMALAALWETWMGPNGEEVDTACIVTTGANGVSVAIHPRLPAIIEQADFETWLSVEEDRADAAAALLRPAASDLLCFEPIGDAVNKVANDEPGLMRAIGPPLDGVRAPIEDQPSLF